MGRVLQNRENRFGFVGDNMTEQKRLGDIATYINGFAFKPENRGTAGLPIIRIQDLTGNAYIEAHESATVVAGKNNIVNSTNAIINEPIKESKIKQWFRPIIQNILSNGIWYILTIIGTFLITKYFT